jgi:hypothetical protein
LANLLGRADGAGGVGRQKIADPKESSFGPAVVLPGGCRIEVLPNFDTSTFERLSALEWA